MRRGAKPKPSPASEMPILAGMNLAQEVCKAEVPDPQYAEASTLRSEATRALKRFLVHAAEHDRSYDLTCAAKALEAMRY